MPHCLQQKWWTKSWPIYTPDNAASVPAAGANATIKDMINDKFVLLGAVLNLIGSATYAYHTLRGETRPNRVTWFLWALAPLIAFSAQLNKGVGLQVLMTFMVGFGPLTVFTASFLSRKAYWKITRLDIACGVLSLVALAVWGITREGNVAIMLSITADLLAGVPTLIKAYKQPGTEHAAPFRNGALSAAITLLTITHWTFAVYGFALYILLICATLYVLIRFRLGERLTASARAAG